jgi:uncharacterized protein
MHLPHELAEVFRGQAETIHDLRQRDPQFRKLSDEYHDLNQKVFRAQERLDMLTEDEEHELRRERMRLKDEIARRLG